MFDRLESHALGAVTSTVTLAEILTKPLVDKNFTLVDEIKFTIKAFSTLSIVAIDEKLAEAAALIQVVMPSACPTPCRSLPQFKVKPRCSLRMTNA